MLLFRRVEIGSPRFLEMELRTLSSLLFWATLRRADLRILGGLVLMAMVLIPVVAQGAAPRLTGFPDTFVWQNEPAEWKLDGAEKLTLSAPKKSDWFAWPGGGYRADASPRLLFRAADDFTISARVTTQAHKKYDAGCLALYGSASVWAKFCLEAQDDRHLAVISVVTRELSDDVTSFPIEGTSAWLKIAKSERAIMFYASTDGKNWTIVRKFNLESPSNFLTGFSAQSPDGEGATAIFENFHYQPGRADLWKLQ
jgi:uncharacterized protein